MDKLSPFLAVKSNLQVSGELTTSRGPGTSFEFSVSLVEQLFGESVAKEISDSMVRTKNTRISFVYNLTEKHVYHENFLVSIGKEVASV